MNLSNRVIRYVSAVMAVLTLAVFAAMGLLAFSTVLVLTTRDWRATRTALALCLAAGAFSIAWFEGFKMFRARKSLAAAG